MGGAGAEVLRSMGGLPLCQRHRRRRSGPHSTVAADLQYETHRARGRWAVRSPGAGAQSHAAAASEPAGVARAPGGHDSPQGYAAAALAWRVATYVRVQQADVIIAAFGQAAYDSGCSLRDYSETIEAVVDGQRAWKRKTACLGMRARGGADSRRRNADLQIPGRFFCPCRRLHFLGACSTSRAPLALHSSGC